MIPFRTLALNPKEYKLCEEFDDGKSSEDKGEEILKKILDSRGMGHLLYSEKKLEKWSGYTWLDRRRKELWLL
jgi:hypothetical protein